MGKVKKLFYFTKKAKEDYFNPMVYEVNQPNNEPELKKYYFLFDYDALLKGGSYEFDFDENRIPVVKGHISDSDGGYFYNPQAVGQFGLALYHKYLDNGQPEDLDWFKTIGKWFLENYQEAGEIVYWPGNKQKLKEVYLGGTDQKISSMSQSRGISIMLRAYNETKEEKYLSLVERAMKAYETKIEEQGFLDEQSGLTLFEESRQPRILNHMIFTIFGLYDYCRFYNFETKYQKVFEDSIASIKQILPNYDCGWWSLYDDYYEDGVRRVNPCTRHYHYIHIKQLDVLYDITGDGFFKTYSEKFQKYDNSHINRLKMLKNKVKTVKKMKRL